MSTSVEDIEARVSELERAAEASKPGILGIGAGMRAALRSRLERLEVVVEPKKPQPIRAGYLKTLPADYVGERHVVIVKREPSGAPNGEWRVRRAAGACASRCTGGAGLYHNIYRVSGGWDPPGWKPRT